MSSIASCCFRYSNDEYEKSSKSSQKRWRTFPRNQSSVPNSGPQPSKPWRTNSEISPPVPKTNKQPSKPWRTNSEISPPVPKTNKQPLNPWRTNSEISPPVPKPNQQPLNPWRTNSEISFSVPKPNQQPTKTLENFTSPKTSLPHSVPDSAAAACALRRSSLAFSTLRRVRISVISKLKHMGIHKYMM